MTALQAGCLPHPLRHAFTRQTPPTGAICEEYQRHFMADFPTRSTIQDAATARGARVEIEVVAAYG